MPVGLSLPGYNPGNQAFQDSAADPAQSKEQTQVGAYKIPLAVWPFVFLIAGYLLLRNLLD